MLELIMPHVLNKNPEFAVPFIFKIKYYQIIKLFFFKLFRINLFSNCYKCGWDNYRLIVTENFPLFTNIAQRWNEDAPQILGKADRLNSSTNQYQLTKWWIGRDMTLYEQYVNVQSVYLRLQSEIYLLKFSSITVKFI